MPGSFGQALKTEAAFRSLASVSRQGPYNLRASSSSQTNIGLRSRLYAMLLWNLIPKWHSTWRLLCSSLLVLTCFLVSGYHILPKMELHKSLQGAGPSGNAAQEAPGAMPKADAVSASFRGVFLGLLDVEPKHS